MRFALTAALLLPVLFLGACHHGHHAKSGDKHMQDTQALRHVVIFKFKDTATPEQVQEIVEAFADLKNQIDTIKAFEHGVNISTEGNDQGFTHVFVATFEREEDLQAYGPHAAHQAFVAKLRPQLAEVFVVDYWATQE